MAELILPPWVLKDKHLEKWVRDQAEKLKKYANGEYGSVEETARFHRAKEKADQAIADLNDALQTIRQTMTFSVVGDVGTDETRQERKARADWLAEIDATCNKEYNKCNSLEVFYIGMDLFMANPFLMGIDQKLKEIASFNEKRTHSPSKFFESCSVTDMTKRLGQYNERKSDIDAVIDLVFAYAGLRRPDRKTVIGHQKRIDAQFAAREKARQ